MLNLKSLLIGTAFILHGVLTYVAFQDFGYGGYFPPFTDTNTTQIFSDLVIALSFVLFAVSAS